MKGELGNEKRILFITWDGPQVNYLEALFLPIFRELQKYGYSFSIFQLSWKNSGQQQEAAQQLSRFGLDYRYQSIPRWNIPLGTLWALVVGARRAREMMRAHRFDAVIGRSVFAGMIASRCNVPFVYDSDGLALDERVDTGLWSERAWTYRILRDQEAQLVHRADLVLNRTEWGNATLRFRAGLVMEPGDKFRIVQNGRDESLYRPKGQVVRKRLRESLGLKDGQTLLVHLGSAGPQYCFRELLDFLIFSSSQGLDCKLLLLTKDNAFVAEVLAEYPELLGRVIVTSCESERVPDYLTASDVGVSFRRKCFSMNAVSPLKIGEYLLCGLPTLVYGSQLREKECERSLVLFDVEDFSAESMRKAVDWVSLVTGRGEVAVQAEARLLGECLFGLEAAVQSYRSALDELVLL